jgi:hypothetical protein
MQFELNNGYMEVTGVPADTTRLLVLINGVKCYECEVTGSGTARIAIRDGLQSTDMAASLPACRGGLLQLYAVNDGQFVLGTTSLPNFCHTSMQRGGGSPITGAPTRAVASALRRPNELHRWEFPVPADVTERVLNVCVTFEPPPVETTGILATVRWVLPLGCQWGTVTGTTLIDKDCLRSSFAPLLPPGTDSTIQCEVGYGGSEASPEMRYVIHHHVEPRDIPPRETSRSLTPGRKLAVLVGVSKYTRRPKKRMGDLEYADDDIVMWYEYLRRLGYECKVFGDEFSPYPQWDGPATVRKVREAVRTMVQSAGGPGDRLVFITSSHGAGDGRGNSYLCLLPDPCEGTTQTERQGSYMDHELATDLSAGGRNQSRNFVFIDACFSGGLIEELLDSLPNVMGTTTCTRKGYGYDDAETCSGAWTNGFLTRKLAQSTRENLDLAAVFADAQNKYVTAHPSRGDRPCFFGRCAGYNVNTESDEFTTLPQGVFTTQNWLALM